MARHIELIIDYIRDGEDFQYCDNTGAIVRCKDCKHHKGRLCRYFSRYGTIETDGRDYCSNGEKDGIETDSFNKESK